MATFYANPDETNEPWIERAGIKGLRLRNWHYMFFFFSAVTIIVVCLCCCIKFRVPRTKLEIEADHKRRKLTEKFRKRLKLIKNHEMGDLDDLQKVLDIIHEDYKQEEEKVNSQSQLQNISPQPLPKKIKGKNKKEEAQPTQKQIKFIYEPTPSTSAECPPHSETKVIEISS